MKINCIIIEDQPPAQRVIIKYLENIHFLNLCGVFNDGISAQEYLMNHKIDLLFLDIHLPNISGIDFINILEDKPQIILTTAFSEYAIQGYELDIADYLLKPFSFQRFLKAVNKAVKSIIAQRNQTELKMVIPEPKQENKIFVKSGFDYIKLDIDQILYIKSDGDYTIIYTSNNKHIISQPLKYWKQELETNSFFQVHKSYLINTNKIEKISGNIVFIDSIEIPIGRAYKDEFIKRFIT